MKLNTQALAAGLNRGVEKVQNREGGQSDKLSRLQRTQDALQSAHNVPQMVVPEKEPVTSSMPEVPLTATTPISPLQVTGSKQYIEFCRRHNYMPGQTIEWPIDKIDPNPDNPRSFYNEVRIQGLAVSIASTGQGEVVKANIHETDLDRVVLWEGERRIRAAKHLGHTTIAVRIDDIKTPLERYLAGRELNTEREEQTCLDDAVAWNRLIDKRQVESHEELATLMKVSLAEVSMTLAIGKMPREILEEMAARIEGRSEDKFGLTMAYEVQRYFKHYGVEKTLKLVQKIKEEDLPLSKVRQKVRESLEETKSRATRQTYNHRHEFKFGERNIGNIKMYGDDSVKLELTALAPEMRDKLFQQIKDLVSNTLNTQSVSSSPEAPAAAR